jgi:hypothetical protein
MTLGRDPAFEPILILLRYVVGHGGHYLWELTTPPGLYTRSGYRYRQCTACVNAGAITTGSRSTN